MGLSIFAKGNLVNCWSIDYSDEGILWKRFLDNPDSSVKNFEMAEEKMLKERHDMPFMHSFNAMRYFYNYTVLTLG